MSELAKKLIVENIARRERGEEASYLDLGRCGLRELPDLSELEWLEVLVMANGWQDWAQKKRMESRNKGKPNQLSSPPVGYLPVELKQLVWGGEWPDKWPTIDLRFLMPLTKLTTLYLGANEISDVAPLGRLGNLNSLYLSDNLIDDVEPLKRLSKLNLLYLSDNLISDAVPLEQLNNLIELDLSGNQISNAVPFGQMSDLTQLNLRFNQISKLPPLWQSTKLTKLDLGRNLISGIESLRHLSNLAELDLRDNQISDVSPLGQLGNLTELHLEGNQILDAGPLGQLSNLTRLYLSENKIHKLGPLWQSPILTTLDLSGNQVSNVESLRRLRSLKRLYLGGNRIANTRPLGQMSSLTELDLRENKIRALGTLWQSPELITLDLSGNQINNVNPLSQLSNLNRLDLSNNQISDIDHLEQLSKLAELDLRDNQIGDLSPLLPLIKKGILVYWGHIYVDRKGIHLFGNPLTTPPPEIVQQGNAAILQYFEDLEKEGEDQIYEAKLILIGEGGAGKTSLCRKLFDPEAPLPQEKERTRGIDIHPLYFAIPGKEDKQFRLNIWDFGGQGKYQSAHSFFYTHRSLYVLVDDTRTLNENEAWRALYNNWLQTAELFGGQSPVLVLHNEKEGCARTGFSLGGFQERFGFVHGELFRINLGDGDIAKIEDMRRQIERQALALPHIGDTVPKTWVKVREAIEEERQRHPYISAERYRALCAEAGISDPLRQSDLSRYFHDLGVFLHFQDNPLLKRDVFLQNQWVTDAVYKILDDAQIAEKQRGRFDKSDLDRLWSEGAYRERRDELLALMLQFELCYQVQDTETYVCPQLLPGDVPPYEFGAGIPLQLKYEYGFMPKGLLYRLIVRLHRHIAQGQTAVWNSGVALERQGAHADIIESLDRRTISVRATGLRAKELVTIINEEVERLHEPFGKRLKVAVKIPCNCRICKESSKPHFYDKTDLDTRLMKGKATVECSVSYDDVPVLGLLEGVFAKNTLRQANDKLKLFISYSKHDLQHKDTLLKHLSGLRNKIVTWHDRDILPGEDWDERIKAALHEADVVLYLVTHNSLATEYIQQVELPLVEERCAAGECILVPVIVDFCVWTELDFAKRNALPEKGTTVTDGKWKNENEAWTTVVRGIKRICDERKG
jgi:Leucine-rich repeat (LRR) protein